jgi:hypothetical protein
VRIWPEGGPPSFDFEPRDHVELVLRDPHRHPRRHRRSGCYSASSRPTCRRAY